MSADDLDLRMAVSAQRCDASEDVRCIYVAGHEGPCWSSSWDKWGGLSPRCYAGRGRDKESCIRAAGHRGSHEGQDGATWRQR